MKANVRIAILFVSILVVVTFVFLFSGRSNSEPVQEESQEVQPSVLPGMDTTINKDPLNPLGTHVLYELLAEFDNTVSIEAFQTTQKKTLKDVLKIRKNPKYPDLYVSFSPKFDLYPQDARHLLKFVEAGNYAFISSDNFTTSIVELEDDYKMDLYYLNDTSSQLYFTHNDYKTEQGYQFKNPEINFHGLPKFGKWFAFDPNDFNNEFPTILKDDTDYSVAFLYPYGDGFFIFHAQPKTFSNVNIVSLSGKDYAEKVFSHFPANHIKWHKNFSKYSETKKIPRPVMGDSEDDEIPRLSPLEYVFKNRLLFTALVLIIIGTLFYILIFSKRRQAPIPPIESRENESLAFAKVIGNLYYKQRQHSKLAVHQRTIFRNFLREKYFINTSLDDSGLPELIANKSGIELKRIESILQSFDGIENKKLSDNDLINLHIRLTYFYQNCN